jgi:hypothetical protein
MKIIRDTLQNGQGKFSRKSLTTFVSFMVALTLALTNHFLDYELNLEVFRDLLYVGTGTLLMTVGEKAYNKYNERKKA